MIPDDETWFDDDAGPLVRPYAVTRGRTRSAQLPLDMITLVVAVSSDAGRFASEPEYTTILKLCQRPLSIAEIAASMALPLGVVKVLISDLVEERRVIFRSGISPDKAVLFEVLHGIRKL
ncbi:MAG: DUF742 domain-containing protein [Actinomycetales bacterium]|nr:DUF742 domain-containing protein [Actinomycetales bacterium]